VAEQGRVFLGVRLWAEHHLNKSSQVKSAIFYKSASRQSFISQQVSNFL
jgi:hypothetical protein